MFIRDYLHSLFAPRDVALAPRACEAARAFIESPAYAALLEYSAGHTVANTNDTHQMAYDRGVQDTLLMLHQMARLNLGAIHEQRAAMEQGQFDGLGGEDG